MNIKSILQKIRLFFFQEKGVNYGVIIVPPTKTDFIAGVRGGIVPEIRNPSGNWENYLPDPEWQNSIYFDTRACVSFSATNCIEAQVNFMLEKGEITREEIADWLDSDGNFNLSDRFLAKMSGTTFNGNTLQKVADTLRHIGIVSEKDWHYPRLQREPVFDWDEYYQEPPQWVKDKALKFLEIFEIKYEWVVENHAEHLKHAPLQISLPLCPDWNTGEVPACGLTNATHAVTLFNILINKAHEIFDSYNPFAKTLAPGYPIPWAMKIIINKKPMYQLIRKQEDEDTYYLDEKIDTQGTKVVTRVHIGDSITFDAYQGKLWGDRQAIKVLTPAEFNAIKKSGVIIKTNSL